MHNTNLTQDLMKRLRERLPPDSDTEIPPRVFVDMEGECREFQEGRQLLVRFPVKERYRNPLRFMQGGMVTAAIDNTLGPLADLVAPPSVTTFLNTTYIRPVTMLDAYIDVRAKVVERTKNHLYLNANVTNCKGKLIAICHSGSLIIAQP